MNNELVVSSVVGNSVYYICPHCRSVLHFIDIRDVGFMDGVVFGRCKKCNKKIRYTGDND